MPGSRHALHPEGLPPHCREGGRRQRDPLANQALASARPLPTLRPLVALTLLTVAWGCVSALDAPKKDPDPRAPSVADTPPARDPARGRDGGADQRPVGATATPHLEATRAPGTDDAGGATPLVQTAALPSDPDEAACAELLHRAPVGRPTDPNDPLFLVNRGEAIPSSYPFSATSTWTPCSWDAPPSRGGHDFFCLPAAYVFRGREALRKSAFESLAPADVPATFDGLPIGRHGKIGFGPLLDEAREAGHGLWVRSGFRSYATQRVTFIMWIQQALATGHSHEQALRKVTESSARAGHSEHQLGTTVDLVFRKPSGAIYTGWDATTFAESPAMRWLEANAHRFGVVLTYGKDKTHVTQYKHEPWHYRFVGVEAAGWMKRCGLSTEEYLEARYGAAPPPSVAP